MNKMFEEAFDRALQTFGELVYNQGYNQGVKDGQTGKISELLVDTYEMGLNEAWECARKIMDLTSDNVKRREIIGDCAPKYALTKYSASEAITKIKEYEEKQKQTEKSCKTCGNIQYLDMCDETCVDRSNWTPKQKPTERSCDSCNTTCNLNGHSDSIPCLNWTPKQTEKSRGEIMDFPDTFEEFAEQYGFTDKKEYYSNGIELIPVFRVEQWLEHLNVRNNEIHCGHTTEEIAQSFIEDVEAVKDQLPKQLVKIGDEIYSSMTETKAVVYHIDAWHRYDCFTQDGCSMCLDEYTFNKYWIRTGRNFPQIGAVLHLMKETNNDRTETTDESNR